MKKILIIMLLILLSTLSLTLLLLLTGSQYLIFLTLFLSTPGLHSRVIFIVVSFIIGCMILFILLLLTAVSYHQKAHIYTDVEAPFSSNQVSTHQIELQLNRDADAWHQFRYNLSDSDKINYVLEWGALPLDFKHQYHIANLSEATHRVVTPLTKNQTELVFIFQNGTKFIVLVSGGRPMS